MPSGQIRILADALIIDALLSEPNELRKNASFIGDFGSMIESYFSAKIDKENPIPSVINLLGPGVLWSAFKAMGFGRLGFFLGLLMNVFDIDVDKLLEPLLSEVRGMVQKGVPISSAQVSAFADQAAQQFTGANADDGVYSSATLIHHAKILKLAIIDFEQQNLRLMKEEYDFSQSHLYKMAGRAEIKEKSTSLLAKIIGFIITVILMSAGLLVAGDAIRTLFKEPPSHEAGTRQQEAAGPVTTQTKFKPKQASPIIRNMNMTNNPQNIEAILLQFAKESYDGLDGQEGTITSTPGFQAVKNRIAWFNSDHPNSTIITIPPEYTSKKQIVDNFIDEVAKESP
jgi:hypothetical protein